MLIWKVFHHFLVTKNIPKSNQIEPKWCSLGLNRLDVSPEKDCGLWIRIWSFSNTFSSPQTIPTQPILSPYRDSIQLQNILIKMLCSFEIFRMVFFVQHMPLNLISKNWKLEITPLLRMPKHRCALSQRDLSKCILRSRANPTFAHKTAVDASCQDPTRMCGP